MAKKSNNTRKRDAKKAATVKDTAELVGVSERQVRRVLDGEHENEKVISVFMTLTEGNNRLLEEVRQLIPFKQKT